MPARPSAAAARVARLRRPRRRRRRVVMAGCVVFVLAASLWVRLGPLPASVTRPSVAGTYTFVDRVGRPLSPAQPVVASTGGPPLSVRAARLAAATIAAEDERFRSHPGVDAVAVGRVAVTNLRERRLAAGGSTITQQLVKLRLGRRPRGLPTKAREMLYALRLEHRRSKTEILSDYLAEAPYGGTVVGAEAAARFYFGKPPSQLTWAEAAFLAALPQRPTAYDPRRDPGAARARQQWILRRLRGAGKITEAEARAARAEPLRFTPSVSSAPGESTALAPHLAELLTGALREAGVPGGRIRTTLDAGLQADVAGIARRYRALLRGAGAANVAVVVLDNRTGAVRAWEGSGDYFDWDHGGMLNGPLLPRQTGSTIKPFIYAVAFSEGASPGDLIDDTPVAYDWNGRSFRPENYDKAFRGTITLRQALGSSVNVPAVKLVRRYTPATVGAQLTQAGLRTPSPPASYGLALALGSGELDLLSMARAYAAFARGGRALDVRFVDGVSLPPSVLPPSARPASVRRPFTAEAAFLVTDVLADNEARAPAFGRRSALAFPFPVAAKTGTSQDFHDNWVIGYTAEYTIGVWVGNFDRAPLQGATGVTGAGPIFHSVVLAAQDRLVPGGRNAPLALAPSTLVRDGDGDGQGEWVWAGSGRPSAPAPRSDPSLRLVEPVPGARYLLDPTTPTTAQRLPLAATGGAPPYRFTVDGRPVDPTTAAGRVSSPLWPLATGRHQACAWDAAGGRHCAAFEVR